MKSAKYIIVFVAFLIVPFLMFNSCKKDENANDTTPQTTTDFRDGFVGDYNCMSVHHTYSTDTSGWIIHHYDTTWNVIVNVGYHANDSSILVIPGGESEQVYVGDSTFKCVICSEPKGYTKFLASDGIYVYKRASVNTYWYYYGHKL